VDKKQLGISEFPSRDVAERFQGQIHPSV